MKKIDLIMNELISAVKTQIKNLETNNLIGYNALDLSIDLKLNRANVSKLLNELWKRNQLIKINGRPTLFIPISITATHFPNQYFSTYYQSYDDFNDALNSSSKIIEKTQHNTLFLDSIQKQLSIILSFPLIGYPPLVLFEQGLNAVEYIRHIYDFLLSDGDLTKNTQFYYIDCYLDMSLLKDMYSIDLNNQFQQLSNSFYFINNLQALSPEDIKKLDSFFTKVKSINNKLNNTKFVLGCDSKSNIKVPEIISYTIETTPFSQLSILDKLQFIIDTFKTLSKKIDKDIRIQKDLFKALCINEIDTNYFIITKDISNALIKAHFRSEKENRAYCLLLWSDFSFPLIHKNIPKHTPLNIIDSYFDDVLQFNKDQTSKFDYIFNQPIVHELIDLILKINFSSKTSINSFIKSYINKIKNAKVSELQSLTIHSGYSKFQKEKIKGNEQEVGLDFLTTQLNILNVENFNPINIEYLIDQYNDEFPIKVIVDTALLLLIDSRHNISTYSKLLDGSNIPSNLISIRTPLSIDELSKEIDKFLPINNIIIVTDINIYQNLDKLLQNVVSQNIITYFPLSIPIIETLIDKIENNVTIDQLHKEMFTQPEKIGSSLYVNEDNLFLQNLIHKFLIPSLTFLDAQKAINELYPSLTNILNKLKLSHNKEFVVKYLVHTTFLIERCIKKDYLEYPQLNKSLKENITIFHIIERELLPIEEVFGINIPLSEIAYIVDIFNQS